MNCTHTCNALRPADAGQTVTLVGWVDTKRDLGGVTFVDLRDRAGVTQVVFRPGQGNLQETAQRLKTESVIEVIGQVTARSADTVNGKLGTGASEVVATSIIVHNVCADLPFPMDDDKADKVNEDLRLEYRFLDLRRPRNLGLLKLRHAAGRAIRHELDEQGFLEVETPTLFKSTPEGAREFLVPSRTNPGEFYALTQSPQQYKQMLMVAGVERYYQMARCYRDEDLRADRQPEFTQLDVEMSFVEADDVMGVIEGLVQRTAREILGLDVPLPLPRLSWDEAMESR